MRTSRPTARIAMATLGLACLSALTGCGAEAPSGAAADRTAAEPPAPAADEWLLPASDPEGLYFEGDASVGRTDARLTLYGEEGSEDPLAGPVLAAHFEPGNEQAARMPCHGDDFEDITVQGAPGTAGQVGDRYWVCWQDTRTDPPDVGSPNEFAVVGRGVPEEAVLAAAEAATVDDDNRVTVPAEVRPDGLQQLAQGPVSLLSWWGPQFQSRGFTWSHRNAGRELTLYVGEGEAADGLLARFAFGGTPTTIRGSLGNEFEGSGEVPRYAATWWESGHLVMVTSSGAPRATVDDFIEGLAPATEEDVQRLFSTIVEYPPAALIPPQETLALGGHNEHAVWAVGVDGGLSFVHGLLANGGGFGGSSGPGPEIGDQIVTAATVVLSDGEFFAGYANAKVARTVLVTRDGTRMELPLADSVTEDGGRYFGTYLLGKEWQEIYAYDADGELLERFERGL